LYDASIVLGGPTCEALETVRGFDVGLAPRQAVFQVVNRHRLKTSEVDLVLSMLFRPMRVPAAAGAELGRGRFYIGDQAVDDPARNRNLSLTLLG
jgi:hypothetical protein